MRVLGVSFAIAASITLILALATLYSVGWFTRADTCGAEARCAASSVAKKIPDASKADAAHVIVEQYKAYVTDLGALGSQFGSVQTFYLTIVSGLLALLALNEKGRSTQELLTEVSIGIFLLVIIVCASWFISELRFDDIFAAKLQVLREMEQSYPAQLFPMYTEQSRMYRPPGTPGVLILQVLTVWLVMTLALAFVIAGLWWRRSAPAAPPEPCPMLDATG